VLVRISSNMFELKHVFIIDQIVSVWRKPPRYMPRYYVPSGITG
jgi:hypothetical protein